ncbi:hypothetical protein H0484_06295 [Pusillimonas sp. CC-YST705]|uniref:Uncharacterized protein n=1 Tax=Mesopusillimonas faecipullorum TaxID=2755040 RepID=A0ABS8CBY7_9BURK|nr:hypothetical protein [Mesopusillimonas faecipullorum]MCB5363362.1 hypothetical protein [Mesopusillimonas faecipullorum]
MRPLALLMRLYYSVLDPLIVWRRQATRLCQWGGPPASINLSLDTEHAKGPGSAQALSVCGMWRNATTCTTMGEVPRP